MTEIAGMTALVGVLERSLIMRSVGMWLLVRLAVAPFATAAGGHPVFLSAAAALMVIAVCVVLCWLVTHRWFEDLMLANLGASPWMVACLMVLPPVVLELAVARLAVV